jgi:ribosomal protein S18 acetylase RimI-like enzyme
MTVRDEDVLLVDSGLPCDTFNVICRARFTEASATTGIRSALRHFRDVRRPFSWWTGSGDSPPNLGRLLEEEGLIAAESETAMFADLSTIRPNDLPSGLTIERVTTGRQLRDFADVSAANWTPPDGEVLRFYDRTADAALSPDCPLRLYVGYLDGAPVATAECTIAETTAGLYGVATRSAYRSRGIGSAMTVWPLIEARREDATLAILQASAEGLRIYERLGFESFGHITEYKPSSATISAC